jgi:hypothetical protein
VQREGDQEILTSPTLVDVIGECVHLNMCFGVLTDESRIQSNSRELRELLMRLSKDVSIVQATLCDILSLFWPFIVKTQATEVCWTRLRVVGSFHL